MDGPSAQGFLSLTGPLAPRVVDCPLGNAYKVSVTGFTFSAIWQNKHSADWLAALATPYPDCAGLLHGKACHTILRSLCSLTNRVPLPPLCRGQNKTPRSIPFTQRIAKNKVPPPGGRWWRQPPKGVHFQRPPGRL